MVSKKFAIISSGQTKKEVDVRLEYVVVGILVGLGLMVFGLVTQDGGPLTAGILVAAGSVVVYMLFPYKPKKLPRHRNKNHRR